MPKFQIVSDYKPSGDQPEAIESLARGVELGLPEQTLLGVTGSGKTFTMANIIEKVQRPTLVLAHNKTLAAQLCSEFREFFPNNAVEYLRLLLRLLPAGSLYPHYGHLHRKRFRRQRRARSLAPFGHICPARAAGCDYCGQRFLHLWPG